MPSVLLDSVKAYIKKHTLLIPGQKLVVGVSGGPDSMALLHLLTRLQADYDLDLVVAHVNHGLRAEASRDADFVGQTAKDWGLPCMVEQVDVAEMAEANHLSLEEAGRLARYTFFARLGETVAVAHNADDQAETVLMHLLRGSGIAGLRGMRPLSKQPMVGDRPQTVIRPLLETPRAEIEAYLAEQKLAYVVDASNLDQTFFRNRLRHELIPFLETYNPNIREVLRRTAEVMAGDHELLADLVEKTWPEIVIPSEQTMVCFRLAPWRALPLALRRALLRKAVHQLRPNARDLNFTPLENALQWAQTAQSGHVADVFHGLCLGVMGGELQLGGWRGFATRVPFITRLTTPVSLLVPGTTRYLDYEFTASVLPSISLAEAQANPDTWTAYLNADLAPFTLRTRRPGDRFQPLGMTGTLKLSDYMINRKMPVDERATWPLVCGGAEGETVLWVPGYGVGEAGKVMEGMQAVKVIATTEAR